MSQIIFTEQEIKQAVIYYLQENRPQIYNLLNTDSLTFDVANGGEYSLSGVIE